MGTFKSRQWVALIMIMLGCAGLPGLASAAHESCPDCHTRGKALKTVKFADLCGGCHSAHAIYLHAEVVPARPVAPLPLDKDGRMTCITCHEPHGRGTVGKMLRMEQSALCGSCHTS